jgi:pantoate--beta-alanine ligase
MSSPLIERTPQEVKHAIEVFRASGARIGFVPTMGALHEGHMALIDTAKKHCDKVVVSIFVNPTQFGPNEDFSKYPRTFERDYDLIAQHGGDMVFLPDVHSIYPEGFASQVSVKGLTDCLCGMARVGHFDGVATIVSILLNIVRPDISFFGEKDYQQVQVIRRIHADLHLSGTIHTVPTVREPDGLALSSRNRYLSSEERAIAPILFQAMQFIKNNHDLHSLPYITQLAREMILNAGFTSIDYFEVRDGHTLALQDKVTHDSRIFVAARLGSTRLIDNIALFEEKN